MGLLDFFRSDSGDKKTKLKAKVLKPAKREVPNPVDYNGQTYCPHTISAILNIPGGIAIVKQEVVHGRTLDVCCGIECAARVRSRLQAIMTRFSGLSLTENQRKKVTEQVKILMLFFECGNNRLDPSDRLPTQAIEKFLQELHTSATPVFTP